MSNMKKVILLYIHCSKVDIQDSFIIDKSDRCVTVRYFDTVSTSVQAQPFLHEILISSSIYVKNDSPKAMNLVLSFPAVEQPKNVANSSTSE